MHEPLSAVLDAHGGLDDLKEPVVRGRGTTRSKTVSWHDPVAMTAAGATLPGRAFLQAILEGRLQPPPMAVLIGAELVSVGEGEAVFRCTPDESTYNPLGIVHGGLLCTLLDTAAGCAVHSLLPAGAGFSSIELKVSFLAPIHAGDRIEVHGRVLRIGGRVAFAEAHARDERSQLVGHATTTLAITRP